jgi:hypothetical protein
MDGADVSCLGQSEPGRGDPVFAFAHCR